jgi:hypothetical protein
MDELEYESAQYPSHNHKANYKGFIIVSSRLLPSIIPLGIGVNLLLGLCIVLGIWWMRRKRERGRS